MVAPDMGAGGYDPMGLSPDPEAERRPGVDVFPMTCHSGGSVEIYLDPVLPAPRLVVYGDSAFLTDPALSNPWEE